VEFDLLIKGATIHYGDGAVAPGDVGVLGDWIAAVGKVDGKARRTVEAKGRALAPGFIDIHSHADLAVLRAPRHECKILQGVTTEVFTSCGLGFAPITPRSAPLQAEHLKALFGDWPGGAPAWQSTREYLDAIRASVNVAYFVSHGALRAAVKGYDPTPAAREELKEMRALARRAAEEGAVGMSTGLYYKPMSAATAEETAALSAEVGGVTSIHIRDMNRRLFPALDEAFEICARSRVPLQISHLQAVRKNRGKAPEMIRKIEEARARGLDVTGDVYPYTAGSTMLSAVKPEEYEDIDWSRAFLVETGECIGTAERARSLSGPYLEHNREEAEVEMFVKLPYVTIGSDGLHVGARPHPRLWGTFPRVLAKWGLGMIPKMTSLAAKRLGLKDRGVIRERAAADLVLLNRPRDLATFEDPTRPPEGIDLVVVNGVVVAEGGKHTGATPGRVLRR
jgi:N-acyl-D-amino-acid deacylase